MINLILNDDKMHYEAFLIVKLFYTDEQIEKENIDIKVDYKYNKNIFEIIIDAFNDPEAFCYVENENLSELKIKRYIKRYIKCALYNVLSKKTGKKLPWGSLTGIRPTKLYFQLKNDENRENIAVYLEKILGVSREKTLLLEQIVSTQSNILTLDRNNVDFYVGIPFCLSRCYYCSFISTILKPNSDIEDIYREALIKEIIESKKIIDDFNLKLRSVYVGGGTPTSFNYNNLDKILKAIDFNGGEYTVEAGRPDTITDEKLEVISKNGANRISINPQTFNEVTLKEIGRNHSIEDIYTAFDKSSKYNFSINMDLIAGLKNDTYIDFVDSLNKSISFNPDNITVHTLCIKAGSMLKNNIERASEEEVCKMVESAYEILSKNDYLPYYIYRQKYMTAGLENVGFSKKGKECIYNIDTMDENLSILACGAGAVSKIVLEGSRVERYANPKDINTYINKIDEIILKKKELFSMLLDSLK